VRPLTKNEKVLLTVLILLVFVGGNITAYRWFQSVQTALDTQYSNLRTNQLEAENDLKRQDIWAARKAWLKEREPSLGDEGSSKAQVLEVVLKGARDNKLEIVEQNLDETQHGAGGARITVDLKVKGSMESLCRWLTDLQRPENFYAVLSFSLKADQDQKSMVCSVQIARYFQEGS
jgi:hypothetical protein